jgi:hypothetical protein
MGRSYEREYAMLFIRHQRGGRMRVNVQGALDSVEDEINSRVSMDVFHKILRTVHPSFFFFGNLLGRYIKTNSKRNPMKLPLEQIIGRRILSRRRISSFLNNQIRQRTSFGVINLWKNVRNSPFGRAWSQIYVKATEDKVIFP